MCGITGIFDRRGSPVDEALLRRMCDALQHRGPDDAGLHLDGSLGLGHRRLSIIDLAGGHQPLASPNGDCVLVFNGEIYNFEALRSELQAQGHSFRTRSDTEVILVGYQAHGERFVERLEGMFAFAIWDSRSRSLLLARDRLGIKPLYVYEDERRVAFASEIKSLLCLPNIDRSWDMQALHDYFAFRYLPGGRTPYRSIRELAPGHTLTVEANVLRTRRYWTLRPARLSPEQALAGVSDTLARSVRAHMIADVEIGAFLSGGIDSGLVVAHLVAAAPGAASTFTIYDPDVPFYDERVRARQVAECFGTRHREIAAKTGIAELWKEFAGIFDEPFGDSMSVPHLVVSRATRAETKVALSGLGGDELFAGYRRYLGFALARRAQGLPVALRRAFSRTASWVPERWGLVADWSRRFARLLGKGESELYTGLVTDAARADDPILTREFLAKVDPSAPLRHIDTYLTQARELGLDPINRVLYTDLMTFLPDDLLRCADRTSMAASLEVRVPFVDRELIELALAIPGERKIRRGKLKGILRSAARELLPREIVDGPKRGFSVPMAEWLRGPLAPFVERAVEDVGPGTGLLERAALRRLWAAHREGRESHEVTLWSILVFSHWAESTS